MYQIKNFMENDDVKVIDSLGAFSVVEYQRDLSVMPETAMEAFYASQMNVRKRQVVCDVSKSNVTVQAGAMQWMVGNVKGNQRRRRSVRKSSARFRDRRIGNQTGIYRRRNIGA